MNVNFYGAINLTKAVLPIMKAQKQGFVKNMNSKKFIITPSFADAVSVKLSYLCPISMGKMITKMTKKANK